MQDDEGNIVDIYIPRKCSATNRLITSKDHASVQIEVAQVSNQRKQGQRPWHALLFDVVSNATIYFGFWC